MLIVVIYALLATGYHYFVPVLLPWCLDIMPYFLLMMLSGNLLKKMDFFGDDQEIIQKNPEERLNYDLVGESGPDHDKRFEVNVMLNSNMIGHGIGKSKKSAEQLAAKEALELMGE